MSALSMRKVFFTLNWPIIVDVDAATVLYVATYSALILVASFSINPFVYFYRCILHHKEMCCVLDFMNVLSAVKT